MIYFRRVALISLIIIFIFDSLSNVFAGTKSEKINNDNFQEILKKVEYLNIDKEVDKLVLEGMTRKDAEYYIKLDKVVDIMEKEGVELRLDGNIEEISDRDFINNKDYYRKKILQGDKSALKKAILSVDRIINGKEYTENIVSTFSGKSAYEIIYPDGSKIIYNTKSNENKNKELMENENQESLERKIRKDVNNVVNMEGVEKEKFVDNHSTKNGYKETIMDDGLTYAYEKLSSREGEWSFESGVSFSKVYLYSEFELNDEGVSTIRYARGGQASYGIINIANSTGATISRAVSQGKDLPAEARNEVVFTVSGSFGASFLSLSISVEPGMNWTQYIIFRLYEPEMVGDYYASRYEWYAADYK